MRFAPLFFAWCFACTLPALAQDAKPHSQGLADGFDHPPESAKPRTWWHWVSGNVSREGITADLEAMKEIGLAGFQNFTVDQSAIHGPVKFMSSEWRGLVKHSIQEASRLGLEMSMEGCDGWCESGGPWVPAAESMQKVVWTEKLVQGGAKITLTDLAQPEAVRDFYEDIALFAVPSTNPAETSVPKVSFSTGASADPAALSSNRSSTELPLIPGQPPWVQYEFPQLVTFGRAQFQSHPRLNVHWQLQASDDGQTFRKVTDLLENDSRSFPPVTARFFRCTTGGSEAPKGAPKVTLTGFALGPQQLDHLEARTGIACSVGSNTFVKDPTLDAVVIDPKSVVNLTGAKEWQAPAGAWRIIRLGHTSTGVTTHPSTNAGLECDKLSAEAVRHHIDNMFGPVVQDSPEQIGATFKYILLDSWEVGCENWTGSLPSEFKTRRGYDLTPWLPALSGQVLGSPELTQRFLWDYRRTLADLVAEKHYGTFQAWAHQHKMGLTSEATGIGMPTVADQLLCKKYTNIPMGEFWVNKSRDANIDDPKETACAAHIYGQNIAAAESFTSTPNTAAWKNDPASLKALGDEEFCLGINRFVFHRYAHQPWLDRFPGMSMGPWGINFERTNTWWKPGSAWISYLSRCQFLLQQGEFNADLLYFYGEGAPVCVSHGNLDPAPPHGYDYDVCNADILLNQLTCHDGHLALPSGMVYRVLVLPKSDRMTLPVLKKVQELVEAGAIVYGPKPLQSPSLTGYPDAEDELHKIADAVWGNCDGATVLQHSYGKGMIVWGAPLAKIIGAAPDFVPDYGDLLFIHRHTEDTDLYFVSNQESKALTANCSFRETGKVPELWHPDTGQTESVALYSAAGDQTTIPIHFDPAGSVFVLFKKGSAEPSVSTVTLNGSPSWGAGETAPPTGSIVNHDGKLEFNAFQAGSYELTLSNGAKIRADVAALPVLQEITGPWQVQFPPKLGAPDSATLDHLISWADSPVEGIRYFSGTATYNKNVTISDEQLGTQKRLYLDLGRVKNLAEVILNGKNLGVLWKEPFQIDITEAAHKGDNQLEIRITNLWPNRLIGDVRLADKDQRITWTSVELYKADSALLPSGLLGPVKLIPAHAQSLSKPGKP